MGLLVDPYPLCINPKILAFFINRITVQDGAFLFTYQDNQGDAAIEFWSNKKCLVPVSTGMWLVYEGLPAQVRHLFLSNSATDILCFCQQRPEWLKIPGSVAFASLGLLASEDQISFLKLHFVNAKVHTVFDAELTGRVTDCKVALWKSGKDAFFKVTEDLIQITYRKRKFNIPATSFSLNHFEKVAGIRSGIRTHKPKNGYCSFREQFNLI